MGTVFPAVIVGEEDKEKLSAYLVNVPPHGDEMKLGKSSICEGKSVPFREAEELEALAKEEAQILIEEVNDKIEEGKNTSTWRKTKEKFETNIDPLVKIIKSNFSKFYWSQNLISL